MQIWPIQRKRRSAAVNEGERLFIAYLDERMLHHEPWPQNTSKQPGRLVHTENGEALFEFKDIELDLINQEFAELLDAALLQSNIEKAIVRLSEAVKKLPAVSATTPFLPALYSKTFSPNNSSQLLQKALYGQRSLSLTNEASTETVEGDEQGFFANANNGRVSALAILWLDPVNKQKWAEHLEPYLNGLDIREAGHAILQLEPRLKPEFEKIHGSINKQVTSLAIFHNPFAIKPLSQHALASAENCHQVWYCTEQNQLLSLGKMLESA